MAHDLTQPYVDAVVAALLDTDALTANREPSDGLYLVHEDNLEYLVRTVLDLAADQLATPDHGGTATPRIVAGSAGCEDCGGTGLTKQGWTDKGGFPEDQYGPCGACRRRALAASAHPPAD